MKLTVGDLRKAIEKLPDELELVFQGNIEGDEPVGDEPGYTTCTGYVYSVFPRDKELVIDCAITDSEI